VSASVLSLFPVAFHGAQRVCVMGIINCTPDSFSDGGSYLDPQMAVDAALQMIADGAGYIDIGGESSRPGSAPVPVEEELRRVLPVLKSLRKECCIPVSVDTCKAAVAEVVLAEGADMINDICAMADPQMAAVVARSNADIVLMHMQGVPRTMQDAPVYTDVTGDVISFLQQRTRIALDAGISVERIVWDPGFGFGKALEHNLTLFSQLSLFHDAGHPILVGVSRKSLIGKALGLEVDDRMIPSVTLAAMAVERGAAIVRVHDVRQTVQAVRMAEAVLAVGEGAAC